MRSALLSVEGDLAPAAANHSLAGTVRSYSRATAHGVVAIPNHDDVPFVGTCYYGRRGSDRWPHAGQDVVVVFAKGHAHPLAIFGDDSVPANASAWRSA